MTKIIPQFTNHISISGGSDIIIFHFSYKEGELPATEIAKIALPTEQAIEFAKMIETEIAPHCKNEE